MDNKEPPKPTRKQLQMQRGWRSHIREQLSLDDQIRLWQKRVAFAKKYRAIPEQIVFEGEVA